MAYIGKQPVVGNFVKLDTITTSATTTFNLLNGGVAYFPQTANNCIVSLNGVIQSPTSAYTISGSTIVFSDALTSSDTIDFILVLGDVLAIGTPSDATVNTAKLTTDLTVTHALGSVSLPSITFTGDTNTGIYSPTADTIGFAKGGAEAMRIDSSGNVGIGTTTPKEKLDNRGAGVFSGDNATATNAFGTASALLLSTASDNSVARITAVSNGNNSVGLSLRSLSSGSAVEGMRITSGGAICINRTSNPSNSQANIQHAGASEYGLTLDSNTSSGTIYHLEFKRQNTQAGYITSSATTVSVNNTSDARLKENIQNSNSAIQDLKNMQVRQFDWVDNIDTHRNFGFVAQELINVVPEAVTVGSEELNENGKPKQTWGIDYSHIVPRIVKVCQEQQVIIEELKATSTSQQTKIDALEARLTALEAKIS